jgi:DHA1 family tetracycline resistance protein-like MFS transporter
MFWAGIPVLALWGMGSAAFMALMSRLVSASEQGQLQGANASLIALAGLVGPGLFAQTFAWSIAPGTGWHLPGAPFLLAAALLAAGTALAWRVTRPPPAAACDPTPA